MAKYRSWLAGAAVLVLGVSLAGAELAQAQLGAGGDALGRGDNDIGAGGTVTSDVARSGVRAIGVSGASGRLPDGPFAPRQPLIAEDVLPPGSLVGNRSADLVPGSSADPEFEDQAFGTAVEQWPYSTARVAVTGLPGPSTTAPQTPVTSRPYRFSGKLYMRFGATWYICSASLIKKGVVVTAAHCVHDFGSGASGWADEVLWYPAHLRPQNSGDGGPYGHYSALDIIIPTAYYNGTDTCLTGANGVVCNNDIAVLAMRPRMSKLPGDALNGHLDYGWNGYSFTQSPAFGNHLIGQITQLGYPLAIDGGIQMLRNDSFAKLITTGGGSTTTGAQLLNHEYGTAMTGGSSGGPHLVNFGTRPDITGSATLGQQSVSNVIIGVTSWGYNNVNLNIQGASWFGQNTEFPNANYGGHGAGNIGAMVNAICSSYPGRCAPM